MKLIAYTRRDPPPRIRPAVLERDWMDATSHRYAYRCLPLNIANEHGWEVLCPARTRVVWSGGAQTGAISIQSDAPAEQRPTSNFGWGVLTFHLGCLLHTEPGVDLWVSGPPNRPKHGIAPLTGVVEADWGPFTFTMNWKFTTPGEIVFEEGEPYCFFFPLARGLVERTEPEFRRFAEEPQLDADYAKWEASRAAFIKGLREPGSPATVEGWQRHYFRGVEPSGAKAPVHRTRLRVRRFVEP
jgi:hypothetical protein